MTISFRSSETTNAPIVALHSSASSSGQWRQLEADFNGRFDVHAFDLPGYGCAPLTRDPLHNGVAATAASVIREIEKLGSPVHLVGHSNGGAVAIKVALMRADLVKSLTVYEPACFHLLQHGTGTDQRLFDQIRTLSDDVSHAAKRTETAAEGIKRFLDFWNGDGFWHALPAPKQQKLAGQISSIVADFANGFAEIWTLNDLAHLQIPTLVMSGLDSPEIAQHVATEIAKALPNARSALLPELGHMAPIFQPEWVNSRIFEHVATVERPIVTCSWPSQAAA